MYHCCAVLALQVQEKAEGVAAPMLAAQQQKEAAKETKRRKYVATGPARQSKRAGAERTRAKLQQQAQQSAESSDDEQSISSDSQESPSAGDSASKPGLSKLLQKRKRSTQEAEFDPAGQITATHLVSMHSNPAARSNLSRFYLLQTLQASHHLTLMHKIQRCQLMVTSTQVHCRWRFVDRSVQQATVCRKS